MKRQTIALALAIAGLSAGSAFAQEGESEDEAVIIPSRMELDDEQKAELQKKVEEDLAGALKKCVAEYPRPEFFTSVLLEYELRKSGDLRGGYVGGSAPDPNLYVKSDEERAKKEEEGEFTRMVVRNDRDLERCMKKETGGFDTGFDRFSATVSADITITWDAKKPTLEVTRFDVSKS